MASARRWAPEFMIMNHDEDLIERFAPVAKGGDIGEEDLAVSADNQYAGVGTTPIAASASAGLETAGTIL